jgi:hypothetical protein
VRGRVTLKAPDQIRCFVVLANDEALQAPAIKARQPIGVDRPGY